MIECIITKINIVDSYFGRPVRAVDMTGKLSTNFFPFWVRVDVTHPDGTKGWQRCITLPITGFWRASFPIKAEGIHRIEVVAQWTPFGIDAGEPTIIEFDTRE